VIKSVSWGTGATAPERRSPAFNGSGGTLFGMQIVNLLLTALTVGIYYFWGKTRIRHYAHGQMEFDGDVFGYHGTGRELLFGWLKAIFLLAVLFAGAAVLGSLTIGQGPGMPATAPAEMLINLLTFAILAVLMPIVTVGSRRYRLSRTSWRGIRFSFRGRVVEFMKIFIIGSLLTLVTLGLYYPFFYNNMWSYLINNTSFGTKRFTFDGKGADLFRRYVLALILSVITLGIYWPWFAAERNRYYWGHTTFGAARFRSTMSGRPLFGLWLGDLLLLVFTLGLALPWVAVRNIRFLCANLSLEGPLDMTAIQDEAAAASPVGEEMADFLGLDIIGLVPG